MLNNCWSEWPLANMTTFYFWYWLAHVWIHVLDKQKIVGEGITKGFFSSQWLSGGPISLNHIKNKTFLLLESFPLHLTWQKNKSNKSTARVFNESRWRNETQVEEKKIHLNKPSGFFNFNHLKEYDWNGIFDKCKQAICLFQRRRSNQLRLFLFTFYWKKSDHSNLPHDWMDWGVNEGPPLK